MNYHALDISSPRRASRRVNHVICLLGRASRELDGASRLSPDRFHPRPAALPCDRNPRPLAPTRQDSNAPRTRDDAMTRKRPGEHLPIEWTDYPRIPPGEYSAVCAWARKYYDRAFKRWTCLLLFDVLRENKIVVLARIPMPLAPSVFGPVRARASGGHDQGSRPLFRGEEDSALGNGKDGSLSQQVTQSRTAAGKYTGRMTCGEMMAENLGFGEAREAGGFKCQPPASL